MCVRFSTGLAALLMAASGCSNGADAGNTDGGGTSSGSAGSGSASSGSTGSGASSGTSGSGSASSGAGSGASTGSAVGGSGAVTGSDGGSGSASGSGSGSGSSMDAGDGGAVTGGEAGTGADGSDGAVSPVPYPGGPYCAPAGSGGHLATGCVIPNLTWNGYVDDAADAIATTKPYRSYSLNDVYNDARVSGKRYAMINIAEYLCPGCQHSALEMATRTDGGAQTAAQAVVQAGGVVVEVLMTDGFSTAAKMGDAATWVNKYMLNVTTVADLDPATPTLNTLGLRDQAYIIDLTTMTVVQYIKGSTGSVANNSGSLAMAAMHTLLGK